MELPPSVSPFGAYVPAVRTGNLLFLTGMPLMVDHEPKFVSRAGKELNTEQAYGAAYTAAPNALAAARQQVAALDKPWVRPGWK